MSWSGYPGQGHHQQDFYANSPSPPTQFSNLPPPPPWATAPPPPSYGYVFPSDLATFRLVCLPSYFHSLRALIFVLDRFTYFGSLVKSCMTETMTGITP